MRGAGDMLGTERYNEARQCLYTARAESDVVIYAFPEDDFGGCVLKHPHAAQYVAAEGQVTPDYQGAATRHDPHRTFLHALVGQKTISTCAAADTVAHVAERMLAAGSEAVAMLEADDRLRGVLTRETLLRWVAAGGGDAHRAHDRGAGAGAADRHRSRRLGDGRRPRDGRDGRRGARDHGRRRRATDGFRRWSRRTISRRASASGRRRSFATSGRPRAFRSCARSTSAPAR